MYLCLYLWISLVDAVYIRWSMHYIKMENPKKKKNLQLRVMAKLPIKNWWICKSWQYYLNFKLLNLQFLFLTTYNIIIYLSLTHCKRMRKCFSIWLLLYFFSNQLMSFVYELSLLLDHWFHSRINIQTMWRDLRVYTYYLCVFWSEAVWVLGKNFTNVLFDIRLKFQSNFN